MKRLTPLYASATILVLVAGAALAAEPYPTKLVTLVVPFAPGGTTDVFARAIGQGMARQLGQPVVVENKAGASGTIGASQVRNAKADGYTILIGGPADQVNAPFLMAKPPYDPARDFEPIGCVVRTPNVLVANPKLKVQTPADVIRLAKMEPGKLTYASAGNGNTSHLLGELFSQTAGVSLTHVPYKGNGPALTDIIGGQVDMMFSSPVAVVQHIKSGQLRAIATTSAARLPEMPNVPTLKESGIDVEIYSWACLVAPAKTAPEVLDKLHDALNRALEDPAVVKSIETTGGERFAMSRDATKKFLAGERSTWGTLIRARNIHAD